MKTPSSILPPSYLIFFWLFFVFFSGFLPVLRTICRWEPSMHPCPILFDFFLIIFGVVILSLLLFCVFAFDLFLFIFWLFPWVCGNALFYGLSLDLFFFWVLFIFHYPCSVWELFLLMLTLIDASSNVCRFFLGAIVPKLQIFCSTTWSFDGRTSETASEEIDDRRCLNNKKSFARTHKNSASDSKVTYEYLIISFSWPSYPQDWFFDAFGGVATFTASEVWSTLTSPGRLWWRLAVMGSQYGRVFILKVYIDICLVHCVTFAYVNTRTKKT